MSNLIFIFGSSFSIGGAPAGISALSGWCAVCAFCFWGTCEARPGVCVCATLVGVSQRPQRSLRRVSSKIHSSIRAVDEQAGLLMRTALSGALHIALLLSQLGGGALGAPSPFGATRGEGGLAAALDRLPNDQVKFIPGWHGDRVGC